MLLVTAYAKPMTDLVENSICSHGRTNWKNLRGQRKKILSANCYNMYVYLACSKCHVGHCQPEKSERISNRTSDGCNIASTKLHRKPLPNFLRATIFLDETSRK